MEVEAVQRANCVIVSIATEADVKPASQVGDANILRVGRVCDAIGRLSFLSQHGADQLATNLSIVLVALMSEG
jgi:hypothetical protein